MLGLDPATLLSRLVILVIAFTIHEYSHARVADAFGDTTPRMYGRLTLNPLAHLDIMGSIMLLLAGFGWAKPVPINPYALGRRSSAAPMLVSLAGPASNFLLAILAAIPVRAGWVNLYALSGTGAFVAEFVFQFIFVNLLLTFFNLIPLAPLDGDKIADYFFPPSWARVLQTIRPYGGLILIALLFVLPAIGFDVLGKVLYPPIYSLMRLLIG